MNKAEILSHIDHTLLKPIATWEDIKKICDESIEYKTESIYTLVINISLFIIFISLINKNKSNIYAISLYNI